MSARFLLAAGGTGGHVYPALAVAEALVRRDAAARVHFVGGRRGIEGRLVPGAGFSLTRLPAAGLRGLGVMGALRFSVAFSLAFVAALVLVLRQRPDVVLATGGYASAAPAMAAAVLGRPLWLQEQNSVPGSTNRMLSRYAERAYVAFAEAKAALARAKDVVELPNPVRGELVQRAHERATADDYAAFELDATLPTVLVFGGSRGAATLNRALREGWAEIESGTRWQVLAQTGETDWEVTRAAMATDGPGSSRARVLPYIEDMARAYRVADLVICRAGALTLAELAVLGKPSVLVPFPHATDDHQTRNARAFEERSAARVVADEAMDGARLAGLLAELDGPSELVTAMAEAARTMSGGVDAASEMAQELLTRAGRTSA